MKKILKALETMTAGELEAKAQSANDKPRKAPTRAKSKTKGTKGKGNKGNSGNPAPGSMSAETMEEITLQYFRNVAKVTTEETFTRLQQSITDPHIIETGTDYTKEEFDEIENILVMPEEKKLIFTAGHLQQLFKYQANRSFSTCIEETLHFYQKFFPEDSRSHFRLAVTAGYILDSGRLKEYLRA